MTSNENVWGVFMAQLTLITRPVLKFINPTSGYKSLSQLDLSDALN